VRLRRPLDRALVAAAAVLLGGSTAACTLQVSNLNFRVDKRLHFTAPRDRELVTEPVTVSWRMRDFTIEAPHSAPPSRRAGYFAIFVDRSPIRPGQTLDAVAHGDRACELDPHCPNPSYLAARQVYTTTHTSFTLHRVAVLTGTADNTQLHDVTVVLLDTSGRRIGESFWTRTFAMKKRVLA
jgi:hypothetical protein